MHQVKDLMHCTDAEAKTFLDGMLCSSKDVFKKFLERREEESFRVRILNDSPAAHTFATFFNNLQVEVVDLDHQNRNNVGQSTFEDYNLIRNWSSVSTLSYTNSNAAQEDSNGDASSERTSEPSFPGEGQLPLRNGEQAHNHDDGMENFVPERQPVHDDHMWQQHPRGIGNVMEDVRPAEIGLVQGPQFPEVQDHVRSPLQRSPLHHQPQQQERSFPNQRSLPKLMRRLRPVWKIFVGALHSSLYDTFIVTMRATFSQHDMKFDTSNKAGYCFLYIVDIPTVDAVQQFMAECRLVRVGRNPLYIALAKGNNPRALVDYVPCFSRQR